MRTRALTICSLLVISLALICTTGCKGPKKGRYDGCPTFSKELPKDAPVAHRYG